MTGHSLAVFHHHVIDFARARGISSGEALIETRAMGYDGLVTELRLLADRDSQFRAFQDAGLRVLSIFASIDFIHQPDDVCARLTDNLLETASFFGTGNVLVLPGCFQTGDDTPAGLARIHAGLARACRQAAPLGIAVTIEDFGIPMSPNGTIADCARMLDAVPGLQFTFDTGNFSIFGEDPHQADETVRGRIAFVHLKDHPAESAGKITGLSTPVGAGALDLGALIRRLLQDGYGGDFAAEHFDSDDQETAMRRSAAFCRAYF